MSTSAVSRFKFAVILDTPAGETEQVLEVRAVDRLKAELEASRQKIPPPKVAPQHHTALWLWCALVRTGQVTVGFQEFKNDVLVEFDAIQEPAPPDPTQAAPSASPSPSHPSTGEAPATGSAWPEPTTPSTRADY